MKPAGRVRGCKAWRAVLVPRAGRSMHRAAQERLGGAAKKSPLVEEGQRPQAELFTFQEGCGEGLRS